MVETKKVFRDTFEHESREPHVPTRMTLECDVKAEYHDRRYVAEARDAVREHPGGRNHVDSVREPVCRAPRIGGLLAARSRARPLECDAI